MLYGMSVCKKYTFGLHIPTVVQMLIFAPPIAEVELELSCDLDWGHFFRVSMPQEDTFTLAVYHMYLPWITSYCKCKKGFQVKVQVK